MTPACRRGKAPGRKLKPVPQSGQRADQRRQGQAPRSLQPVV